MCKIKLTGDADTRFPLDTASLIDSVRVLMDERMIVQIQHASNYLSILRQKKKDATKYLDFTGKQPSVADGNPNLSNADAAIKGFAADEIERERRMAGASRYAADGDDSPSSWCLLTLDELGLENFPLMLLKNDLKIFIQLKNSFSTPTTTVLKTAAIGAAPQVTLTNVHYYVTSGVIDKAHSDKITADLKNGVVRYPFVSCQAREWNQTTNRTYDISVSNPVLLKSYFCWNFS
jgi:hypothetical protein